MSSWLQRTQARGRAAPKGAKTLLLLVVFFLPLALVVGHLPPFTTFLDLINQAAGEDQRFRHLLAYLLCVTLLLVPAGLYIQWSGARAMERAQDGAGG